MRKIGASWPIHNLPWTVVLLLALFTDRCVGFVPTTTTTTSATATNSIDCSTRRKSESGVIRLGGVGEKDHFRTSSSLLSLSSSSSSSRSDFLRSMVVGTTSSAFVLTSRPSDSVALVKGNAPPPPKKKKSSSEGSSSSVSCNNVEECQERAERLAAEEKAAQLEAEAQSSTPVRTTPGGIRYKDVEVGSTSTGSTGTSSSGVVVATGDTVGIYYKVLKIGKRSFDGISGEGTVVFSRGYGYEDDEVAGKVTPATVVQVGSPPLIAALSETLPGMTVGAVRRVSVPPQKGWEIPNRACDGGPGGRGTGGDLKTDYVVVPTATMVATETCFDKTKLPFPTGYAEQRRMAQRFDQSLIVEVKVVEILAKAN